MPATTTARSVFLSYAREDAEPARRIADALRGFGVEVWFDQSELRGGDAWDAKIKRQIRECTLFVALISAHSQGRREGYFRREWKLAIERTHDMAAGVPFLLPVVVDGTPESGALVPEEFMRVQWTRLADGAPTPQFVEQVSRLLEAPLAASPVNAGSRSPVAVPAAAAKARLPGWIWGVAAGVAIAVVAVVVTLRQPAPAPVPPAPAVATPAPATAAKVVNDKSIAVLPFANMSEDKANAFFADGMQEDVLTNLALVHELRVVSRTSVLQYRDTTKPIKQIAAELGVAYILEGSVRRSGNKVRVTGQLIHAASDEHIWAKAFDRDLTDIFAIQSELAQAIAAELQAALSPEEKVMLDRRPTENAAAYDLYLQARRIERTSHSGQIVQLLESATRLDPNFARAWGDLSDALAYEAFDFLGPLDELRSRAKAAIDRAMKLAPEDPEVIQSLGTYYYYGFRDYGRAGEIYQKLLALRPNDAGVHNSLGLILRRQGRWSESLANFQRATELDVADAGYLNNLISCLGQARRYDELAAAWKKMAALQPGDVFINFQVAVAPFLATGSRKEGDDFIGHLSPETAASPEGMAVRANWADLIGNSLEAIRLRKLSPHDPNNGLSPWEENVILARAIWFFGGKEEAQKRLGSSLDDVDAKLAKEPLNPRLHLLRAMVETVLGNRAEAIADSERARDLMPESVDAVDGGIYGAFYCQNLATLGEREGALAAYQHYICEPGAADVLNVYQMKADQDNPLRDDPRFQALLNDPKNNAPLF